MKKYVVRYNGPSASTWWPLDSSEDIRMILVDDETAEKIDNGDLEVDDANPVLSVQLTSWDENEYGDC